MVPITRHEPKQGHNHVLRDVPLHLANCIRLTVKFFGNQLYANRIASLNFFKDLSITMLDTHHISHHHKLTSTTFQDFVMPS